LKWRDQMLPKTQSRVNDPDIFERPIGGSNNVAYSSAWSARAETMVLPSWIGSCLHGQARSS
jgi:hypothetical protein